MLFQLLFKSELELGVYGGLPPREVGLERRDLVEVFGVPEKVGEGLCGV